MLWDLSVRTDHEIEAKRPDLLIIDKNEKNYQIIDVIPEDGRVKAKEDEKDKGSNNKGDSHSGWGIGKKTSEVKRKSENHRCRHPLN